MDSPNMTIRARGRFSMPIRRRVLFHSCQAFRFFVVLLCIFFCIASAGPFLANGLKNPGSHEGCEIYGGDGNSDLNVGDNSRTQFESVCSKSNAFCFPSTLSAFFGGDDNSESSVEEDHTGQSGETSPLESPHVRSNSSWSSDYSIFKLLSGHAVSCSLNSYGNSHDVSSPKTSLFDQKYVPSCEGSLQNQRNAKFNLKENTELIKSGYQDSSLSPHVRIGSPSLDWGQKYLYFPSVAFLTVANTHHENSLYLYEPFSTNGQFYPCNFSEVLLAPGEEVSLCFVFLPTWLGVSTAHLILQTSFGGFLIHANGVAVESPYGIPPFIGVDVLTNGRWRENLSLFNSFDDTLFVEEITAWISVSSGGASHSTAVTCRIENFEGYDGSAERDKEWLDLSNAKFSSLLMAMRPHRKWDIGPGSTESILEINVSSNTTGNLVGAVCLQLLRSSKDKSDTILIPFKAELGGEAAYFGEGFDLLSLELVAQHGACEAGFVTLSVRNFAPKVLIVNKVTLVGESTEFFRIKYMEGLLLFPGTVTQVAVVSCAHPSIVLYGSPSETPNVEVNCKLVLLTNDSQSPQIEVPCDDIVSTCSRLRSQPRHEEPTSNSETGCARAGPFGSKLLSVSLVKATEPDELILGNWKSQGTGNGMSVLDDNDVQFPIVQVGTYRSKWINVRNPSPKPVLLQLILHSGEIIDECRSPEGLVQTYLSSNVLSNKHSVPLRYGFSIAESGLTEVYLQPYETASLGPIHFHPSSRCVWKSSALVRNNLSGVEWLTLQGFGGSLSLDLFEGSKPVQGLDFKFNLPGHLNISPDVISNMEETCFVCSKPLLKELYVKNTGDLPVDVRKIEVSGMGCELDGFLVQTCKGFALQPGEYKKLLISYQADFSAIMLQRDLELGLGSGIHVIPMKAVLPLHMLNLCKKSIFWMRVKKFSIAVLLAAFVVFLVFFFILPQLMVLDTQEVVFKDEKSSITAFRFVGKISSVYHNQKNGSKFVGLSKFKDEKSLKLESIEASPDDHISASKEKIIAEAVEVDTQKVAPTESCVPESSKDGNLTVRIGKEKGRKRRKKKGSAIFDVSSSQSGNSTPSSPLSPPTCSTPRRARPIAADPDHSIEARNQFARVAEEQLKRTSEVAKTLKPRVSVNHVTYEKTSAPRAMALKPVLLPSATFPGNSKPAPAPIVRGNSFLSPASKIAAHARAPGSKLYTQKTEENARPEDQFKYDIWGDHLFGLHLSGGNSSVRESQSDSFFVSGPQSLLKKYQPKSVSCSYEEG